MFSQSILVLLCTVLWTNPKQGVHLLKNWNELYSYSITSPINNHVKSSLSNDISITEIMYNSTGADDEWIEICNLSQNQYNLGLHEIEVNGILRFTFPENSFIDAGNCMVISLGDGGGPEFNIDCPFTPDLSNGSGNGILINSTGTIELLGPNGLSIIDSVTYEASDGANGNGSSMHVIDAGSDNSSTSNNWQEVELGGSPGLNSLIPACLDVEAIIKVEGNIGSYPDISNGDLSPSGLDNTLFSEQFIGDSQSKSYRILSLGAIDITINSISLSGDTSDFIITQIPETTVTYGHPEVFEITFSPVSEGTKTAVVEILSNAGADPIYTFSIQGFGKCFSDSSTITPTSGPPGTVISVTGSNLLTASAELNGSPMLVNYISDNEMELIVPPNSSSGNIVIINGANCTSIFSFEVLNNTLSGCETNTYLDELFISEITDATYGNLSLIELFNATASDVDLVDYSIRVYSNGNTVNFSEQTLEGQTIYQGETFVIAVGATGVLCEAIDNKYDFNSTSLFGINLGAGRDDYIGLYKNNTLIDEWGAFGDDDWMSATHLTGDRGFNFKRSKFTSLLPSTNFSINDWHIIDWPGSGINSCSFNDLSNIGEHDFSLGVLPQITQQPNEINNTCLQRIEISVEANEGLLGGMSLNFQWYSLAPGEVIWSAVSNDMYHNNAQSPTLEIIDSFQLNGYQYYCALRESDNSCTINSQVVQLKLNRSFWDGSAWTPNSPDMNSIAIINSDYDTATEGNLDACQLIVPEGQSFTIGPNDYVNIERNLYIYGDLSISSSGSFVQNSDYSEIIGMGTMIVNKTTSILETVHDYTYWSSPVNTPLVSEALSNANPSRIYWFNAANYEDRFGEQNNDNSTANPPDDVDDNGDVWIQASGTDLMYNGVGFAAMHHPSQYIGSGQYHYSFSGPLNTGDIAVDVFRNDATLTDNNWNLIGNPYPSSIDILAFLNDNAYALNPSIGALDGALYIWSQSTPPDADNNGNDAINFSQDDYIIVNASGAVEANSSGMGNNGHIPSGQAFFVSMHDDASITEDLNPIRKSEVLFKNSMRRTFGNDQFFRIQDSLNNNKIWINLTAEGGLFCQTLIAYIPNASNDFDGAIYDAKRSWSSDKPAVIFSVIHEEQEKYAIQGKSEEALNYEEYIALGFETTIESPLTYSISIGHLSGEFMSNNNVILEDHWLETIHNLKDSDYYFTSDPGLFLNRFSLSFSENSLSVDSNNTDEFKIWIQDSELFNFKWTGTSPIEVIKLYDITGRQLYDLRPNSFWGTYSLPLLKNQVFLTKVLLANGAVLTTKGVSH